MLPDGTCTRYKPLDKPLFTKINGKLKEKFISNEFVNMADILDLPSDLEPFDFYLRVKHNGWLRPASTKLIYVYSIIKSKIIVQVYIFAYRFLTYDVIYYTRIVKIDFVCIILNAHFFLFPFLMNRQMATKS